MRTNKLKELEAEIKQLALIEDAFKALGKQLYFCYLDKEKHNFKLIMDNFHKKITKLEENKK